MGTDGTYCGVVVCEGIVDFHVFKEPLDMLLKEALHLSKVELRVHKDRTNICLDNVG